MYIITCTYIITLHAFITIDNKYRQSNNNSWINKEYNQYIYKEEITWLKNKHRIGEKPMMYIMDDIESTDIDTNTDFKLAEIMIKSINSNKNSNDIKCRIFRY